MNFTTPHISFAMLIDLAEDRLSAHERADSLAHIAACPRCASEMSRLEHIIALMRSDATEDAPPHVIARALDLARAPIAPSDAAPSGLRRILAALSFDSAQLSPAFGVRAGQPAAAARQLLFSAGESDLDLRIAPSGETWSLSGQVLGRCGAGGAVELQGEMGVVRAALNDLCEFTFPPVAAGIYALRLRFEEFEIEVHDIRFGS